ncbi:hypothetical protein [Thiocapsa sp.]|uniref:hypothetical protein n=1 Tax=Thiocapsa sp. TaxID=2024551 RepID=UPI0025FCDE52|nr:hypothetical protein [Thiocapsa sp.]
MHDIDRNYLEYTPDIGESEEELDFAESEWSEESDETFDEAQLMELAAEFLEVRDEEELDYFLGNLLGKAAKAVGSAIKSPVGQALGGILKDAAKKALPVIGSAVGGHFGGTSGAKLGGRLAARGGSAFGLETEGLSDEDEAFEIAKQYVRFAADAAKNAAKAPPGDPRAVARMAAKKAARRLAPGLLKGPALEGRGKAASPTSGPAGGRTGRWVRRGNRIILYGV